MTLQRPRWVPGDIVLAPFPYTEQVVGGKQRPGLVLAVLPDDPPARPPGLLLILCAITTHIPRDVGDLPLTATDLQWGRLAHDSTIRPGRIWTIAAFRVGSRVSTVTPAKMAQVATVLHAILNLNP